MVILHDAMKTIQIGVFVFFFLNKPVSLKKTDLKNPGGLFFLKRGFLNRDCLSILF